MNPRPILITLLCLFFSTTILAQNKNPFESIGKKGKILTLSNGRYEELFDQDSIQQIGTALVNIHQMKVVKLLTDEKEAQRLLDNSSSSRFLSVDPLSNSYPMLTPYQYASNRPIDGTDLDGKEWKKVVTYNPQTGVTNIHFQVKIKIVNCSQYTGDLSAIGDEFIKAVSTAFDGVYDSRRKISYSASGNYEVVNEDLTPSEYGVQLLDGERIKGSKVFIGGMNTTFPNTQQNGVSAAATTHTEGEEEYKPRKVSNISNTILHEIIHTANVGHPMDDDNTAQDVDLTPIKFQGNANKIRTTYFPSPGADKAKILSNIMIYTITGFMGSTVGKIIQDPSKLNKVSPDQAYIIQKQIAEDQNKQKTNSTNQ